MSLAARHSSATLPLDRDTFDPDTVGWSYGEIPPAPWTCPQCSAKTKAIALTDEGLLCSPCFQSARAAGRDPEIYDAVIP